MKKIIVGVILVSLVMAAIILPNHIVKVEKRCHYSYGDVGFKYGFVPVYIEETVRGLNGKQISTESYNILVAIGELPWYNVWTENCVAYR